MTPIKLNTGEIKTILEGGTVKRIGGYASGNDFVACGPTLKIFADRSARCKTSDNIALAMELERFMLQEHNMSVMIMGENQLQQRENMHGFLGRLLDIVDRHSLPHFSDE